MKKTFLFVLFGMFIVTLVSCGGDTGRVGKLTFATLKTIDVSGTSVNNVHIQDASTKESSTWAHVDGMKIKLLKVHLTKQDNGREKIYSNSTGELVTLTPDGGNIGLDVSVPIGIYTGAHMELDASYDLKAWACLGNGSGSYDIYYTTTVGITHKATQSSCVTPTESDYGYYHYDFLYLSTAQSPNDSSDTSQESGVSEFDVEVTSDGDLAVQIVMDIYRLVTFWDGTGERTLSPFNWSNNNGNDNTDFFPDNKVNFGVSYIPIFLSLNDEGSTLGRIYVFSDDQTKVNNFSELNPDSTLSYFVLATTSAGEYLGSRVVGFDYTELDQSNSEFSLVGNLASFYNGERCSDETLDACDNTKRFLKNIRITNFDMSVAINGTFEMTATDTEYCDETITEPDHPEWGNRMHCLHTNPTTFYVKRIR